MSSLQKDVSSAVAQNEYERVVSQKVEDEPKTDYKSYSDKSGANRAIKKQGLQLLRHELVDNAEGRVQPVFYVDLKADFTELESRGWAVEYISK